MEEHIKITVEKHTDGYVAHARCLGGVVLGQGDTREEALADVQSAIEFHKREFGKEPRSPLNGPQQRIQSATSQACACNATLSGETRHEGVSSGR